VVLGLLAGLEWAPVNFLLFLCWMVLLLPGSIFQIPASVRLNAGLRRGVPWLLGLLVIWTGLEGVEALRDPKLEFSLIDIGLNTYLASDYFLGGYNPYVEYAQVFHSIQIQEGVVATGGELAVPDRQELEIYGFRYRYGFPYFPMMFLGYTPFVAVMDGLDSIRVANGIFLVLCGVFLYQLGRGWSASRDEALLPVLGLLAVPFLSQELFVAGVTDLWIGTLALGAYLCLQRGRILGAGVLLGFAQGAKLLPAPLLFLPVLLYLWRTRRSAVSLLLGGFVLGTLLTLGPFLFMSPNDFVSSTILFYVVQHGMGDSTAIYSHIPASLQSVWTATGVVGSVAMVSFANRKDPTLVKACVLGAMAYVFFVAMNRMTHLNYLVAVLPIAALCFLPREETGREALGGESVPVGDR